MVSGLVKHIPEAEMQQRRVLVVANLKPAAMRGITSQAMVLAATHPESGKVCFACDWTNTPHLKHPACHRLSAVVSVPAVLGWQHHIYMYFSPATSTTFI